MRGYESILENGSGSGFAATTTAFLLKGGKYGVDVVASNYGTVKLQKVGADGSTVVDLKQVFDKSDGTGGVPTDDVIGTWAANGHKVFDLPPGNYQFTVSGATAIFAQVVRIPGE